MQGGLWLASRGKQPQVERVCALSFSRLVENKEDNEAKLEGADYPLRRTLERARSDGSLTGIPSHRPEAGRWYGHGQHQTEVVTGLTVQIRVDARDDVSRALAVENAVRERKPDAYVSYRVRHGAGTKVTKCSRACGAEGPSRCVRVGIRKWSRGVQVRRCKETISALHRRSHVVILTGVVAEDGDMYVDERCLAFCEGAEDAGGALMLEQVHRRCVHLHKVRFIVLAQLRYWTYGHIVLPRGTRLVSKDGCIGLGRSGHIRREGTRPLAFNGEVYTRGRVERAERDTDSEETW